MGVYLEHYIMDIHLVYSMINNDVRYILGVYHTLRYILDVYKVLCGDPIPKVEKQVYYGRISWSR